MPCSVVIVDSRFYLLSTLVAEAAETIATRATTKVEARILIMGLDY